MGDLTVEDCNVVVKQCLKIDAPTVDFEAIPRHNDNFIVKITIERDSREETLYFYAKSQSKIPTIDKILYEDFKNIVPGFTPTFTPKFHCVPDATEFLHCDSHPPGVERFGGVSRRRFRL
jgi:hypothetical protein